MKKNPNVQLAGVLLLAAILASACTQTYSQAPLATPTLLPTGLFVSPFPSGQDPLQIVADLGTQTAMAKTAVVAGTATQGTPVTATVGTAVTQSGITSTAITFAVTTPAPVTVVPGSTTTPYFTTPYSTVSIPTTSSIRPSSYTLQQGEFPYCIARRYNLDPDDLLSMNNIANYQTVYPGLTLTIPQTGSFPGERAWHTHPDTYTVSGTNDTSIYGVACYYGDIFPEAVAAANNLSLSTTLTIGQQLRIP
jgi:LysM repeat protein